MHMQSGVDINFFIPPISDAFLKELISEIDDNTIRGIILGGSHARGNPTPYSDVDLACFVADTFAHCVSDTSTGRGISLALGEDPRRS